MPNRPDSVAYEGLHARAIRPRSAKQPQDGKWYWRIDYLRKAVWTGWATRAEVQDRASAMYARGEHLQGAETRRRHEQANVAGLLDRWLAYKEADARPRSMEAYRTRVRHLKAHIGDLPLAPTPAFEVLDRYRRTRRQTVGGRSVANELGTLGAAWTWAVEHGKLRPLHGVQLRIPRARIEEPVRHTPTVEDCHAVFSALPQRWPRVCLALALATGARISELAALRWADVDLTRGSVTFRHTKTHRDRLVPIDGDVLILMRAWQLARPGKTVLGVSWSAAKKVHDRFWNSTCDTLGIPRFSTHGVRRLAVRRLIKQTDPKTAATYTGHSVGVLLRDYVNPTDEDRREAAKAAGLGSLPDVANVVPFRRD